ncbi:S-adenosylmethionine-dependent methyltransferase Rv2258c-like [Watersipora subatra]|uniref:S-adenosylmethionine-dependent methyltransferase Rv2258c-like n=1 Tax=Watersipora subatra TaxID=2589382 RepID=UPI00355AEC26
MAAEKFMQELGVTIHHGGIALGVSVGVKLGLFQSLAQLAQSKDTAVTSQQLADSLDFKERYVREWIGGMVCGNVVDHEEIDGVNKYWLEPYRLPTLLGTDMEWVACYSEILRCAFAAAPMVEKCFPNSGPRGTEVDAYDDLHEFLRKRAVRWQKAENCKLILEDEHLLAKLEAGLQVLELGCGAAAPTKAMATLFPNSTFVASDLSESVLEGAKADCEGLSNVTCRTLDACNIPADLAGQFDLVMLFDVYHDVPQPQTLVDGALNLLKSGGQFFMNEIDVHERLTDNKNNKGIVSALYYTISTMYCLPTCINTPGGEGLGACGGKELYERRLKRSFTKVTRVGEKFGLYFLCTK